MVIFWVMSSKKAARLQVEDSGKVLGVEQTGVQERPTNLTLCRGHPRPNSFVLVPGPSRRPPAQESCFTATFLPEQSLRDMYASMDTFKISSKWHCPRRLKLQSAQPRCTLFRSCEGSPLAMIWLAFRWVRKWLDDLMSLSLH